MKKSATVMGMPATIEIVDAFVYEKDIEAVFNYFENIDNIFSTYQVSSEISKINRQEIKEKDFSVEMKKILSLCEETKKETHGYFDIKINNTIDPSGLVKGYAIYQGAILLQKKGYKNFSVEIAGDVQVEGLKDNHIWRIGIENPFNRKEIIKIIGLSNKGVATSGTYIRGNHIYNPITNKIADEIASISIIAPNVYEADRFATAAFAMGEKGIEFIEKLPNFEGYMVMKNKKAIFTSGFTKYVVS